MMRISNELSLFILSAQNNYLCTKVFFERINLFEHGLEKENNACKERREEKGYKTYKA
jgi:hypothetical protein